MFRCGPTVMAPVFRTVVPRSSCEASPVSPEVLSKWDAFFRCSEGQKHLLRLLVVLHVVIVLKGRGGVDTVCLILQWTGLCRWVAASHGAQHRFYREVETRFLQWARHQKHELAAGMPPRKMIAALDEVFFRGAPCLVAMDVVSNFIFLEKMAEKRDATTWEQNLASSLEPLRVEVTGALSDQAKAIQKAVQDTLHVAATSEVFHVEKDACQAVVLPLAKCAQEAKQEQQEALKEVQKLQANATPHKPPTRGKAKKLQRAQSRLQEAEQGQKQAVQQQQQAKDAIRQLGQAVQPFDLQSAEVAPRTEAQAREKLEEAHATLEQLGALAKISCRGRDLLAKVKRSFGSMARLVSTFHDLVHAIVTAELPTDAGLRALVLTTLIPLFFVQLTLHKTTESQERQRLQEIVVNIQKALRVLPEWTGLPSATKKQLEQLAYGCACLFHRATSCLEGRNGVLRQSFHALHRFSESRLEALTIMHNFVVRRFDGTTAAQRFFGKCPSAFLPHLMQGMHLPQPRAAQPRSHRHSIQWPSQALLNV